MRAADKDRMHDSTAAVVWMLATDIRDLGSRRTPVEVKLDSRVCQTIIQ